ncbi:hypothetical protein GW17_00033484 [Ensete ventricosum]|nr:hypothetical protein GW17_00033484 [Ensete ventricosum]
MRETDGKGGPFVAVRRVSQGPPRGSGCRSSPGMRLLEECLRRLQSRIDVAYDSSKKEHQVHFGIASNMLYEQKQVKNETL